MAAWALDGLSKLTKPETRNSGEVKEGGGGEELGEMTEGEVEQRGAERETVKMREEKQREEDNLYKTPQWRQ